MAFRETINYVPTSVTNYQTVEEFMAIEIYRNCPSNQLLDEFEADNSTIWQEYGEGMRNTHLTMISSLDVETQTLTLIKTWPSVTHRDNYYVLHFALCDLDHPLCHHTYDIIKTIILEEDIPD